MKKDIKLSKIYKMVYKAIPVNIRPFVNADMVFNSIKYHQKMVKDYPDKGVIYFLGEDNTTDIEFILQHIALVSFWNYCGSWTDTVYKLLKDEIPTELCKFFVENKQGGGIEVGIIRRKKMGAGNKRIEIEIQDVLGLFKNDEDMIGLIERIYIGEGFENELQMAKYSMELEAELELN